MYERQLTRIDVIRQQVDEMLKACGDSEVARCGYVHLYGVGQACALLALRRGHDRAYAELAEIAGMLHDYTTYRDNTRQDHAQRSSDEAGKILTRAGVFTEEETNMICLAISRHGDKEHIHGELDEILKDADVMQHWLRNPMEDYFFNQERVGSLIQEFCLTGLQDFCSGR
ncbi:MAG: HD domain-containing protein [Butyrivibrio sp.]|nr:HD domain-containing protein [Acetatifactor muris]MCM1559224.1 HD domain-containing protein [Butyrivibrio sp.]